MFASLLFAFRTIFFFVPLQVLVSGRAFLLLTTCRTGQSAVGRQRLPPRAKRMMPGPSPPGATSMTHAQERGRLVRNEEGRRSSWINVLRVKQIICEKGKYKR